MVHFTKFRPFHQYQSYYPYYLPSWYSRFYPRHYHRYFEPTQYWLERRQQLIDVTTNEQVESNRQVGEMNSLFKVVIFVAVLYVLISLLRR